MKHGRDECSETLDARLARKLPVLDASDLVARGVVNYMVEVYPQERDAEACERAVGGAVRFKAVVTYD